MIKFWWFRGGKKILPSATTGDRSILTSFDKIWLGQSLGQGFTWIWYFHLSLPSKPGNWSLLKNQDIFLLKWFPQFQPNIAVFANVNGPGH